MHHKTCWLVIFAVGNLGLGCDGESSNGTMGHLSEARGAASVLRDLDFGGDGGPKGPDPDRGEAHRLAALDAGWEADAFGDADGALLLDEPAELEDDEPTADGGDGAADGGSNPDAQPADESASDKSICDDDSDCLCDSKGTCWPTQCYDPEFQILESTDSWFKEVSAFQGANWVSIELEQDIWLDLDPHHGRWVHRDEPTIEAGTKVRLHGGKFAGGQIWFGATDWFDWVTGVEHPVASPCVDCVAATCAELDVECGEVIDNCGDTLVCEPCADGFVCDSNRCQPEDCYDPEFWIIGFSDQWWVEIFSDTADIVELEPQDQPDNRLPLTPSTYGDRWVYATGEETGLPELPGETLVRLHATRYEPEQVAVSQWFAWPAGPASFPYENVPIAVDCSL